MIDWTDLVAAKQVAPRRGQSTHPHDAWGYKPPVSMSSELRRILNLPRRPLELDGTDRAEALIDVVTERYARPFINGRRCRCSELDPERHAQEGCITRLRMEQAQALREIGICGGLLGALGVGYGKTLIDLLAPLAFREFKPALNTFVLLVPASLAGQLVGDYQYYGQHFRMPQIVVHGHDVINTCQKMDLNVVVERGAPVIHVVSYTRLSMPGSTVWLEAHLKPDGIIADECHKLRSVKTATGARVWRYMEDIAPHTLFAGLSGSMTARSVSDYWHLAKWALRGGSPIPIVEEVKEDWRRAIDPSDNPADPGPLLDLCEPGEHIYDGFRRRIAETVGVVTTAAPSVDVILELIERDAPKIPPTVRQYLSDLRGSAIRPDGEELMTALEIAECAMQLAFGFYYRWIYPDCEFPRDEELVRAWKLARKEYFREVRAKLKSLDEHMDSQRLVMNAAERFHGLRPKTKGLPVWHSEAFPAWHKIRGMVRAETEAVCFDDYIVQDIAAWAAEHKGVVWYEHDAIGSWVSKLSGLSKYGGGRKSKEAMMREDGSRSILASIHAHGTGTNGLQHRFNECLLIHITPDPNAVEQTLGRLHRPGQNEDVRSYFYMHTPEIRKHISDALRHARYVEATGFGHQKIIRTLKLE